MTRAQVSGRPWLALPLVIGAFVTLIGLGTWQLQRLDWKTELLADIAARGNAPPIPLGTLMQDGSIDQNMFRAVRVTGRFHHDKEIILLARTYQGQVGSHVVTPFELAEGGMVLINRGWVPVGYEMPASRAAGQIAGTVDLIGILRAPPGTGLFTPDNRPGDNQWYWIDIAAIADKIGQDLLPVVIDAAGAANPDGLPVGSVTLIDIPNNHKQYMIAWYGLAATLIAVFGTYAWRRRHDIGAD